MQIKSPTVYVKEPRFLTDDEINDFVAFVLAGGEVTPYGLRNRVMNASHLAYARQDQCLLGVGGLKKPGDGYRNGIENKAGFEITLEVFPFELGWVFVLPSRRGCGLSGALCRPLVAQSDGDGIFATSRSDNKPMHQTLKKLGFARVGKEWLSREHDAKLTLFIKDAV